MELEIKEVKIVAAKAAAGFVENANKKFKRKGLPTVDLKSLNKRTIKVKRDHAFGKAHWQLNPSDFKDEVVVDLVATFDEVKFSGWSFAAVISNIGTDQNFITLADGQEVPERFKTVDPQLCEHCNKRRSRKETFIVRNESGEFKQVGRSCLKDFLGHDVAGAINVIAFWFDAIMALEEQDEDRWFEGSNGRAGVPQQCIKEFLLRVVACTQRRGFHKSDAEFSTKDEVRSLWEFNKGNAWFFDLVNSKAQLANLKSDVEELLDWGKTLTDLDNSFLLNLGNALKQTVVNSRTEGLLACAWHTFTKAKEKEERREFLKAEDAKSKHVGTVGERLQFHLRLVWTRTFDSDFGELTINVLVDENGNKFVHKGKWWGDCGEEFDVKATIKEHSDFDGAKQTVLSRPHFFEKAA